MRPLAMRLTARAVVLGLLAAPGAAAGEVRCVGVLGNSGQAGGSLVRVAPYPGGQLPTGVAVAADCTIWISGGDVVNHLSLSGELLERHRLEPAGAVVDSRTFAVLGRTLYFLARTGKEGKALFALPMRRGAVGRPLAVKLPRRKRRHVDYVLAPQPLEGKLLLVHEPPSGGPIDAHWIDPAAGTIRKAFSVEGGVPHGAAVDAAGRTIYIGAESILAVRPNGAPAGGNFPIPCMKTPAIPTSFRGTISLAGGAIWDAAWYGFLSRHSLDGRNAPGRVVEWHHELGFPKQIVDLAQGHPRFDPLLITTATPSALYYAHWDRRKMRLEFVRRLGCLPNVYSLGLSEDGWVTVGVATCQLWWRWSDAAWAPPRSAKLHVAVTPPSFHREQCLAVAAQYNIAGRQPRRLTIFKPALGGRNEARRHQDIALPCNQPVGQAVRPVGDRGRTELLLTDAAGKRIWRCGLWLGNLRPDGKWQALTLRGVKLTAPTDVVALTDGRLLVADGGSVLMLEKTGDDYRLEWRLDHWADAPEARFGKRIRLAVDGAWMLIADTDRHRLIWLDLPAGRQGRTRPRLLGTFGETDRPGDGLARLNTPTHVSLRGARAVVADAGNQRVLKLTLAP